MRSKRKVFDLVQVQHEELRTQLNVSLTAIQKDLHLIEAALATDRVVISLDDRARGQLSVEATKDVVWVNAVAEGGHVIYWLNHGANPVEEWKLSYRG
jgi:hypothetical protein